MKRITGRIMMAACVLLLVPTLAAAEPTTPEEWYKQGENEYNLGNFDEAVKAFKKGFALETNESKKSAYLYNIAQSYRQAKDCSNSQFFYKRFLALKDADTLKPLSEKTRKDVEDRIKELEECARQQEAIRNRPPDGSLTPNDGGVPDATKTDPVKPNPTDVAAGGDVDAGGDDDDDDDDGITKRTDTEPNLLSARIGFGGAKVTMGASSVPIQPTGALIGGYPILLDPKMRVEVGAAFTFTPIPYNSMSTGTKGTAGLTAALANVSLTYGVAPKMAVRGDLGLGMLFLSSASGSPFTGGQPTTGALSMFHVRIGVSADYELTPNLIATIPLAFSYSPPKSGLSEDIKSITAFDFMVGLGYRM